MYKRDVDSALRQLYETAPHWVTKPSAGTSRVNGDLLGFDGTQMPEIELTS